MRHFLLIIVLIFTGDSYAEGLMTGASNMPESCAEFLQLLYGRDDQPSDSYSLTLKKGADISSKNGVVPTYYLRADGIPKGRQFQIANRNALGRTIIVFDGVHLGNGKLLGKFGGFGSCVPITIGGFFIGEPSQFLLMDSKNNTTDTVFYLPYPADPATSGQLRVDMHYVHPQAYLFELRNLTPEEKVGITVVSSLESVESTVIASKSGKATSIIVSKEDDMPNGEISFQVRSKSGALNIQFPWIRESCKLPAALILFTVDRAPTAEEIRLATSGYLNEME